MRVASLLALVLALLLGGCASLSRDAGFAPPEASSPTVVRQEPWQNMAFRRDVLSVAGVAVIPIALPEPIPQVWLEEFVDPARPFQVKVGKKTVRKMLERVVFRAALYGPDGFVTLYDAVLDRGASGFSVLLPLEEVERVKGRHILIATSDGEFVLTTTGKTVKLPAGQTLARIPPEFFQVLPSPVTTVVEMKSFELYGGEFRVELEAQFPALFPAAGRIYRGRPGVSEVAAQYTALNHEPDKLLSCTSLKFGLEDAAPIVLAIKGALYTIQAVRALTRPDCLK